MVWEGRVFGEGMHIVMRKTFLAGVILAVAACATMLVGAALDLGLESLALLGLGTGAAVALVPDRTPASRLSGLMAGVVVGLLGYVIRAALMPDTSLGRALTVTIVVLLVTAIAAATMGRFPLWCVVLGAAGFAGAYEAAYSAAPPQIASTSITALTSFALLLGIGFLATALANAAPSANAAPAMGAASPDPEPKADRLDDMMEDAR